MILYYFVVLSVLGSLQPNMASQTNLDSKVDAFINKWLPLKHKPHLMHNTVYVMVDLYNIVDLDEVSETIMTKLWMYMAYMVHIPIEEWDELPDIYEIYPMANQIWMPDVIVLNKVETKAISGADPVAFKRMCCDPPNATVCEYCGTMIVFPVSRTEVTTCNINVVDFPFDYQNCVISIGPWMTDLSSIERYNNADDQEVGAYRIEIVNSATEMSLVSYEENSQWELLGAPVVNKTRVARQDSEKRFQLLEFTLKLKRKPQFFIYTLILPCFFLTSLTVLSVLVPVESGEKMGLGVTVLLAQTVNLLILSSFLPASSQFFPQLGYYVLLTIVLISVCLVYNAIIINIYHHGYCDLMNFIKNKSKLAPIKARFETPPSPVDEIVTKMAEQAGVPVLARVDNSEQCSQKGKEEEMRKKRCIVADHVFALVVFLANAILHLSFFCPYM